MWVKRIFLILAGIGLSLIGFELYFRIFDPQLTFSNLPKPYDFHCFTAGTYYPVSLSANQNCLLHGNLKQFKDTYIKTNSMGLRNRQITTPKPKDTIRILFVGDSYTLGWGVDENETFPRLTENILRANFPDKDIEVINAGMPTTGPDYYYLFIKNEIDRLEPDIIVVGFWMVDDIPDDMYYTDWLTTDNNGLPIEIKRRSEFVDIEGNSLPVDLPLKYKIPYLRDLHLFSFIADMLIPFTKTDGDQQNGFSPRACLYLRSCHDLDEAKIKTKKLFVAMKNLADKHSVRMLTVFIPAEFEIDRTARPKYGIEVQLTQTDKNYPYEEFSSFFKGNGIDYMDIRGKFLENSDIRSYFEKDNHWNTNGHKLAAEVISKKLSEFLR